MWCPMFWWFIQRPDCWVRTHIDQVSAAFYSLSSTWNQLLKWWRETSFLYEGKVICSIYTNPGGRWYRCFRFSLNRWEHFPIHPSDWFTSFQAVGGLQINFFFSADKMGLLSCDILRTLCWCIQGHSDHPEFVIWLLNSDSWVVLTESQTKDTLKLSVSFYTAHIHSSDNYNGRFTFKIQSFLTIPQRNKSSSSQQTSVLLK